MAQIESLIDRLKARIAAGVGSPFLIAIDGHSAAGKSTVSGALALAWPQAAVIQTDDFYRVMNEGVRFALSPEEGYHRYYDWQRLLREVLEPLKKGQPAEFQIYDWTRNRLGAWRQISASPVVIVEGCYSARPEFESLIDFVVLVEAEPALRRERQAQRSDASVEWLRRWDAAEQHYIEATHLRHRAGAILAMQ